MKKYRVYVGSEYKTTITARSIEAACVWAYRQYGREAWVKEAE